MVKYPVIISASFLFALLLIYVQEVQSAPSWLDEDTLYKDRTATRRLIMSQLRGDSEEAAALLSPPEKDELVREERYTINPTIDTSPKKLQFVKVSNSIPSLILCTLDNNATGF